MPPTQRDDTFSLGVDVLGTTQQNVAGAVLAQTGDNVNQEVVSDNVECWGPIGLIGRPAAAAPPAGAIGATSDPAYSPPSACQALTINQGSNDIAFAFRDLRVSIALASGEVAIFAPGADGKGATHILLQDGTIKILAGTVVIGTGVDKMPLDSKLQAELAKIAAAFASFIPGSGGASFGRPYTSPGATASATVQSS